MDGGNTMKTNLSLRNHPTRGMPALRRKATGEESILVPGTRKRVWSLLMAVLAAAMMMDRALSEDGVTPSEGRYKIAQSAARVLREDNVEEALTVLVPLAEGSVSSTLHSETALSAVGGGLHRALTQLTAEARFALLSEWSMPAESPAKIRIYNSLVPSEAPPAEFARALGGRPRDTSFPISSIGEVRGIFSSAWSLVIAARESGQLKRLTADARQRSEQKVPNSELLLELAQIADVRGDVSKVTEAVAKRIARLKGAAAPQNGEPTNIDAADVVIACAALEHPTLHPLGEELLSRLLDSSRGSAATHAVPFLREAHATAILSGQTAANQSGKAPAVARPLKYWIPASSPMSGSDSAGMARDSWLVHEDHLFHLAGPGRDALLLRYPLEGDFEFECEAQIGGPVATDGQLIYGGLGFQVLGSDLHITGVDGSKSAQRPCPFVRPYFLSSFNRLSILSHAETATMSVNLHPMWTDKSGTQPSPWLGLGSSAAARPLFRNLKLTGSPVIPRSVRPLNGSTLRGWQAQTFGHRAVADASARSVWQLADGVLSTAIQENQAATKNDEAKIHDHVLFYQRPLLENESVSYEFFYKPGEYEVSPTLGRVAFLIQSEGVRIRWLTDGQFDWTGLVPDNAITEPLNRRGPRPLPLRANDWNRASLARTNDAVTLSLNDELVYQRPVDWSGDHRFGLNRQDSVAAIKVRNLVLTGDWPQALPPEFHDNPLATAGESPAEGNRHAWNQLFHEELLIENLQHIRRKALALPAAERFEFLSRWILPGPDHPGLRVSGDFQPTRPSPLASQTGMEHPELGQQIISPVLDWIDVADELGQMEECRRRVAAVADTNEEFQQRAKVALLLLISLKQKGAVANDEAWEKLFALVKSQANTEGENHWPEMLVLSRGVGDTPDSANAAELISDLATQRMFRWHQPDLARWHTHLASLRSRTLFRRESAAAMVPAASAEFHEWIPVSAEYARTAGLGHPDLRWTRRAHRALKVSSHDSDFLFYHIPLSGNYEIECDLILPTLNPVDILVGGTYMGPLYTLDALETGTFRAGAPHLKFQPKMTDLPKPMRYRAVHQDGICKIFLNGRNVHTTTLPPHADPWIAIHCPGRHRSSVENFRITGKPTVLDAVPLSSSKDLTGWLEYYEEGRWEYLDKEAEGHWIVGHVNTALAGTYTESLLRYQRPLVEDGSIAYEFFYEPGAIESSPSLDRLAFLLTPSGVREHWITDGKYAAAEVRPDNAIDVPQNRRGPQQLPLLPGKWNRLALALTGPNLAIRVNDVLVYERALESTNQRTFGLFHFADATQARVRNVVLRGKWPQTLPAVKDQELAGTTNEWADADLPLLKAVFKHDFAKEGLPEKYFELTAPNLFAVTPQGVRATQTSNTDAVTWEMVPRFALSGDFDIEASFDQIKLEARTQYCGILFRAILDAPQKPCYDLHRIMTHTPQQLSQASVAFTEPVNPGGGQWRSEVTPCETDSGRLRLARRGTKLSYLFAEGNSKTFHLFGTEEVSPADTVRHGVRLQTFAFGGKTTVVWKDVTLRAERMTWFPIPEQANVLVLKIVQADGSGVRTIAEPSTVGYKNIGSPEWSRDGRQLAVDLSNGGIGGSHVFVMNADGTEMKDLGTGCMPSFSADGKRITFSEPSAGIMTMKVDGTDRQSVDRSGWGTQWSPDGKWIAYGKAGNITLFDVATRKSRQLLVGNNAQRYSSIYWNIAWSPDSRGVAFKGRSRMASNEELAFAEINSPDGFQLLQANAGFTYPDISFSPDSQQVIAAMDQRDGKGYRLHAIDIRHPGVPKLLEVIPPTESVDGVAWSPDGKSIAITVLDIAQPTEWVTGMKSRDEPPGQ